MRPSGFHLTLVTGCAVLCHLVQPDLCAAEVLSPYSPSVMISTPARVRYGEMTERLGMAGQSSELMLC